jgi:hypothetical protein
LLFQSSPPATHPRPTLRAHPVRSLYPATIHPPDFVGFNSLLEPPLSSCGRLHEFAQHSLPRSVWAKACYDLQRQRGKKHHAAVRALAFKWIRIDPHPLPLLEGASLLRRTPLLLRYAPTPATRPCRIAL